MEEGGKQCCKMEEDGKLQSCAPHVLAMRRGEGPPLAPHGWKWSIGKRLRDVCFIAPSGKRFRSKVTLVRFLQSFPNPPSLHEFVWSVSSSDFENVPLPGVEKKHYARIYARTLSKGIKKQGGKLKNKSKIRHHQTLQCNNGMPLVEDSSIPGNSISRTGVDIEQDIVIEIPVSQGQKRRRCLRQKSKVCQFCGPLGHKRENHGVEHHGEGHHKIEHHLHGLTLKRGRTDYNCHTSVPDDEISLINLFKEHRKEDTQVISNHSKCLRDAAKVVQAFLTKTGELNKNDAIEVDELRKILLNLSVSRESVKTFPMDVLNAFVLITRNEAAPSALGRRVLVRLCTKWFCKYKRYWCLLEEHRINSVIQKFLCETRSLDQSYLCQKSNPWKYQCMVDPFVEGHHDGKQNADLVLETSSKPEDSFSIESSETLCQYGGSCYKSKPCRECKQYEAIRDAFTSFLDKTSVTHKGLSNCGVDSCGNTVATERQKGASSLLTHKIRINDLSIYPGNEADRKYEDLSNNESVATQTQKVGYATIDPRSASGVDLLGVAFQVDSTYEHGHNAHSSNQCLDSNNINGSSKHVAAVEIGLCNCNSCLDVHFCRGCMCYVCHLCIEPDESWSYIKCSCHHVFHLECIIMKRNGGVVEEKKIDVELLCPVCDVKSDLFPFWRERLKSASETKSKDTLQKHLKSALSVIDGTRRKTLKTMNWRVLKVYEAVTYTTRSDLQQLLVSILEDVKVEKMAKKLEDKTFQIKQYELVEAQKLVDLSQRVADEDSEIYQKAQELVATQKELLSQAEENLKKAEVEMQLANENAKCSARTERKIRKRLELIQLYYEPPSVTKEQVQVQHKLYEQEISELRRIQRMMGSINCCCEESLPELSSLLENMKKQRKKVEVAHRKMERMASLCDS